MAFRSTGLRIMENNEGSLLIVSQNGKMSFEVTDEMFRRADGSEREAALIFRQLSHFILQVRDLREKP